MRGARQCLGISVGSVWAARDSVWRVWAVRDPRCIRSLAGWARARWCAVRDPRCAERTLMQRPAGVRSAREEHVSDRPRAGAEG